ncbi:MAG: glmU [Rhodospirillales bacterium]|jgi:bifunctional UDP-N-acetylglucosamine pyrophosphorylase/glucosamine-1-phosphate N-acetyltransferase|nr:glmU [Rhodospirillales bacterium]
MMRAAIILAAGLGTRMVSRQPKALHAIAGRPMLGHLIDACHGLFDRIIVVVGPGMERLAAIAAPHAVVVQEQRLGTGHAALQAAALLEGFSGDAAVLYADNPLITRGTIERLLAARADADLALLAMRPADPGRYGRVIADDAGRVQRIVEYADASAAERAVPLCNAGVICAAAPPLLRWLRAIGSANAKGEYYLTDVVGIAVAEGMTAVAVEAPEAELRGINTRAELAEAEAAMQNRLRAAAMAAGATLQAPETVFLAADTRLAADVTIGPNVVFGLGVSVDEGSEIRAFSHLEGARVGRDCIIGPYARLRPGTVVEARAHVGNFVELKATTLGAGAKANHLAYLGDTTIGAGANIGAGTITCNYDGVHKHRTEIGEHAFIGSNTALVAPISIGPRALVAAGSTLTEDVPADSLAVARSRQSVKPGRGTKSQK